MLALIDESHQTITGDLVMNMRLSLPNAVYMAFPKTPLTNKTATLSKRLEHNRPYSIRQAVGNGETVPKAPFRITV
ncbi:hypothetical protein IC801_17235 [Geobacillus sp. 44B]|uniref:hypothetical protein n=1 Tax=Saccharococcus caldoxylosilyticus TaxID=81408 RepID=UPI00137AB26F|nr:hypothetical protein IC801_17235 [Geobacillus sp. 44B]